MLIIKKQYTFFFIISNKEYLLINKFYLFYLLFIIFMSKKMTNEAYIKNFIIKIINGSSNTTLFNHFI